MVHFEEQEALFNRFKKAQNDLQGMSAYFQNPIHGPKRMTNKMIVDLEMEFARFKPVMSQLIKDSKTFLERLGDQGYYKPEVSKDPLLWVPDEDDLPF